MDDIYTKRICLIFTTKHEFDETIHNNNIV